MIRDEIFETLNTTISRIREITRGLTEEQLRQRDAQGNWSIKELTGHLLDTAEEYEPRFRRILSEDKPPLGYTDEEESEVGRYQNRDIDAVFTELDSIDQQIIERLRQLSDADWQRLGQHEYRGAVTLEALVEHYADHEREMRDEIEQRVKDVTSDHTY